MTPYELSQCLREISDNLEGLAGQVAVLMPEPEERRLVPTDILRGPGKLVTVGFAPGYRDLTLHVEMQAGQRLQVCLSVQDSLWLHEELTSMINLAGTRPLDAAGNPQPPEKEL